MLPASKTALPALQALAMQALCRSTVAEAGTILPSFSRMIGSHTSTVQGAARPGWPACRGWRPFGGHHALLQQQPQPQQHRSLVSLTALRPHLTVGNCILAANVLTFVGQNLSNGKLTQKFMKSNYHIWKGEYWRLITAAFLHADIMHLAVNSFSLYNLCTFLEPVTGSNRLLVVYLVSAVAGNLMSFYASKHPSVGASTSLFGLTAAEALYLWRHQHMFPNSTSQLTQLAGIIGFNLLYGLSTPGIDNWGHVGGFLGGLAVSWLLGPRYERTWRGLVDKPPLPWFGSGR